MGAPGARRAARHRRTHPGPGCPRIRSGSLVDPDPAGAPRRRSGCQRGLGPEDRRGAVPVAPDRWVPPVVGLPEAGDLQPLRAGSTAGAGSLAAPCPPSARSVGDAGPRQGARCDPDRSHRRRPRARRATPAPPGGRAWNADRMAASGGLCPSADRRPRAGIVRPRAGRRAGSVRGPSTWWCSGRGAGRPRRPRRVDGSRDRSRAPAAGLGRLRGGGPWPLAGGSGGRYGCGMRAHGCHRGAPLRLPRGGLAAAGQVRGGVRSDSACRAGGFSGSFRARGKRGL